MSAFDLQSPQSDGFVTDPNVHAGLSLEQAYDRMAGTNAPPAKVTKPSDTSSDEVPVSIGQKMVSAVSGSLLTSLLVTPLDVVRVRLQSQMTPSPITTLRNLSHIDLPSSSNKLPPNLGVTACCREVFWINNNTQFCLAGPSVESVKAAAADCAVEDVQRKTFTSTFDGLKKIARNEGITTLWRGLSPTLLMAIPANVIYFTGYDSLRFSKHSPLRNRVSEPYLPLVAGSVARIGAAFAVSPIEMFRTRLQATPSDSTTNHFRETIKSLSEMVHRQGYGSLWRGVVLTLWRDVPFSGLYWWGYEAVRKELVAMREQSRGHEVESLGSPLQAHFPTQSQENHTATFVDSFIAGAASGAFAALITTPFDVGKTRQQVLRHTGDAATTAASNAVRPEELPMLKFLWHIFREEGAGALFRGWMPRCLKVAPSCAIMISSYEISKRIARDINERREERNNL
ncbi:mitochondrial carrier [Xylona heveae TC161]|uniref:Mitochondrial carrier n=1 Tax=Xylona heveae (strain CBS 132557 / TC161) TaxID=1328760 RepID=A0A165I4V6_XYLHT|nr:mitochondrial carrier [Xylona heveae TC161]KZF24384.1 mitochondrial carrier [Xylona heveae TC161]